MHPNNHHIIIGIFVATGLALALIVLLIPTMTKTDNAALLLATNPPKTSDTKPDPFNDVVISAKAAIVLDPQTGEIIYSKNINQAMPLASITKIMTALVAEELIPLPEATTVTITKEDLRPEGDSGLIVGQTWKLKDLINFSLISSSNDGIHAVARTAGEIAKTDFIAAMNRRAKELHLTQTSFRNESGLDINSNSEVSAFGSAEDVAQLFAYVTNNKPELIEATKNKNMLVADANNKTRVANNTNEVTDQIPSLLASKTGYTDLSGGNLAVVFDRGLDQKAIVVVLGSTQEARFTDVVTLAKAASDRLQLELSATQ